MRIGKRQLVYMGATPQILSIWRRVPLFVSWNRSGYRIDGVITARNLSAAQVLRFIAAAKDHA